VADPANFKATRQNLFKAQTSEQTLTTVNNFYLLGLHFAVICDRRIEMSLHIMLKTVRVAKRSGTQVHAKVLVLQSKLWFVVFRIF